MAGVDRISALPLELKISILSLLDIECILRTSVLSRSWRHVWTHIPELTFYFFPDENSATALRRVDHVLSSLRGPIHQFNLLINSVGTAEESESESESASLQRSLQIMFEKGALCNLWIFNTGETLQFRLPQFDHLKQLHLCSCSIELPHDFKGFRCLTNLNLHDVWVSENDIQMLINRSGNLTTARLLLLSTESMSVTFSTPLLTELQFRISDFVKSVKVVFAPCLREVHIIGAYMTDPDFNLEENVVTTLRFMASIASVSSLTLDFLILLCFSLHGVPATSPLRVHFRQLKCLRLCGKFAITNDTFYSFLKTVPFIERLEIEYDGNDQVFFEPIHWDECKKQDGLSCLDKTLRSVKIIMITFNIAISMWMPHFILVNAAVLKLMEIKYLKCSVSELKMMDELHQIKPASLDAKLVIGRYFGK